jgi:hypothetical protein
VLELCLEVLQRDDLVASVGDERAGGGHGSSFSGRSGGER